MAGASSTKTFTLIPSVQSRLAQPAPFALLPALPVRLGSAQSPRRYATVDTGAKMSWISKKLLRDLEINARRSATLQVSGPAGALPMDVVVISLTICAPDFTPWIDLGLVPFAVITAESGEQFAEIGLGFDSCLSRLRIDIDYPHNALTVHRPDLTVVERAQGVSSSRLREAELLIQMGSYNAAISMIAAAIEEALPPSKVLPHQPPAPTSALSGRELNPESLKVLERIAALRNAAVHGRGLHHLSEGDVSAALASAQSLIVSLRATDAESRVYEWLTRIHQGREIASARFPDYIVETETSRLGYEIKLVSSEIRRRVREVLKRNTGALTHLYVVFVAVDGNVDFARHEMRDLQLPKNVSIVIGHLQELPDGSERVFIPDVEEPSPGKWWKGSVINERGR